MNKNTILRNFMLIIILFIITILFYGAFTVNQNQVAVVTDKYTDNKTHVYTTGLYWHIPFIQDIDYIYINQHSSLVAFSDGLVTQNGESVSLSILVNWVVDKPLIYKHLIHSGDNDIEIVLTTEIKSLVKSIVATATLEQLNTGTFVTDLINQALIKYGVKVNSLNIVALSSNTLLANSAIPITSLVESGVVKDLSVESQVIETSSAEQLFNKNVESAFEEANRIKTNTLVEEANIYKDIRLQNPKFYNYLRQIDIYRQTSKSKTDIPPLDKIYTK